MATRQLNQLFGCSLHVAVVLRKFAPRKHNRLKQACDQADSSFRRLEQECKSHEVALGSPADYHSQMKLLRLFDLKENARDRWTAVAHKLKKRKQRERNLRKFNGRKLPYSFGLLDMALLFKLIDAGRGIWQPELVVVDGNDPDMDLVPA